MVDNSPEIKTVPVRDSETDPSKPYHNSDIKKMTGVRCPTCSANGQESWVIPGRTCGYCGTNC
ncbi:hypothetical protein BJ875DRAFT_382690 [Amylocarpus encephaloides]|uniref:Uncharacterized protein n=1 Tax=Amylocarpus encephaloides TaxID=45428 RepID=A0A9P7YDD5_9HELO|nr:hypothetical protein BJ875DRAFT_382690 [Amylocarpus encephaloides]